MPTLRLTPRTLRIAFACAAIWLLAVTPGVIAAGFRAPPGNAGAQEYVENVPDGTGGKVGDELSHARDAALANPGQAIDPSALGGLSKSGKDGGQAAALAEAGASKATKGADDGEDGSSPFAATLDRLGGAGGPGGLGGFLPLLLVLLLGGAIGYELNRRRARS